MNSDFNSDIINFNTSKESRKKFKCTLKYLNETYPEAFRRNKIIDMDKAREILKDFYLPALIDSGKASVYYTKDEKYISKHVYMKHPSTKFSVLLESEEAKPIINNPALSKPEKSHSLSLMFPQFTYKQIYEYLKRNSL